MFTKCAYSLWTAPWSCNSIILKHPPKKHSNIFLTHYITCGRIWQLIYLEKSPESFHFAKGCLSPWLVKSSLVLDCWSCYLLSACSLSVITSLKKQCFIYFLDHRFNCLPVTAAHTDKSFKLFTCIKNKTQGTYSGLQKETNKNFNIAN